MPPIGLPIEIVHLEPPRSGHLSTPDNEQPARPQRTAICTGSSLSQPLRSGRPLYNEQGSCPQCIRCSEVSLYCHNELQLSWTSVQTKARKFNLNPLFTDETENGNGKAEIRKWSSQLFQELSFARTVCY